MTINILIGLIILLWNVLIIYNHFIKREITYWTLLNCVATGMLIWALLYNIFN